MAENVLDQIIETLRVSGGDYFPEHSELKAVRVVGHTPKPEHYTYEIVIDFADGSERVSAKIYRAGKNASESVHEMARKETESLQIAYDAAQRNHLTGVPQPLGDFVHLGAVVSSKVNGLPLQSIILKTALLPDFEGQDLLAYSARQAGQWLRKFHDSATQAPEPFDGKSMLAGLEKLCSRAKREGLGDEAITIILANAKSALATHNKPLNTSIVLNNFVPLNVMISEAGAGFCDFSSMNRRGHSLRDAAMFLAAVEALEKYPFCERMITSVVQDTFIESYGMTPQELPLLNVIKIGILLEMFTQGRGSKENALRKKVMWANVMKRFLQSAAERSIAPAA